MIKFEVGQVFDVRFSTKSKLGEIAGKCTIVEVKVNESIEWIKRNPRGNEYYTDVIGTVTAVMNTDVNNTIPKEFNVYGKQDENGTQYMWFAPTKNYMSIASNH